MLDYTQESISFDKSINDNEVKYLYLQKVYGNDSILMRHDTFHPILIHLPDNEDDVTLKQSIWLVITWKQSIRLVDIEHWHFFQKQFPNNRNLWYVTQSILKFDFALVIWSHKDIVNFCRYTLIQIIPRNFSLRLDTYNFFSTYFYCLHSFLGGRDPPFQNLLPPF